MIWRLYAVFRGVLLAGIVFGTYAAQATPLPGVEDAGRAQINYMLNCQGCHRPDGSGTADNAVPEMKNFVGNFLKVAGGRAFLVQVPGSANAALDDTQLASAELGVVDTITRRGGCIVYTLYGC